MPGPHSRRQGRYKAADIVHTDVLAGVYQGVPPTHAYGTVHERYVLDGLLTQARGMHAQFHDMLLTFGPKPDLQVAFWEEDFERLIRDLEFRLSQLTQSDTERHTPNSLPVAPSAPISPQPAEQAPTLGQASVRRVPEDG